MKRIVLLTFTAVCMLTAKSQNTNPCGKSWTDWVAAFNFPSGEVFYRVEYPSKGCDCGWHFVQIQHTIPYKAMVYITLEGDDCDDKHRTSSFGVETIAGQIGKDTGNWHTFKKVTGVTRVEVSYQVGTHQHRYVMNKSGSFHYLDGKKL